MSADEQQAGEMPAAQFRTTRWSVVVRAGAEQLSADDERRALEELCGVYWYPLYSFIRRKGHDPEAARDLTQGFFEALFERNGFAAADRERGRFRTFLLSSLSHFLSNERDASLRRKRGGGCEIVSFDADLAHERFALEPAAADTPERAFDRRWVEVLLETVISRLQREAAAAGESVRFERLKGYLVDDRGPVTFAQVAVELGSTEAAVKGIVRRMRARFRELLRDEVAQTVASSDDVDVELRHLIGAC